MKLVHLVTYNEKFIPSQIGFLRSEFPEAAQEFFLVGGGRGVDRLVGTGVSRLTAATLSSFLYKAYRAQRLVLNGIYSHRLLLLLLLSPGLLRKAVWLPWGGDIYWPELVPASWGNRLIDKLRGLAFRRLSAIATPARGDYQKLQVLYGVKSRHIPGCPNIFSFDELVLERMRKLAEERRALGETCVIQVGNSADPSNNHIEVMEWLARYSAKDIEVRVPLSYGFDGVESYRDAVMHRGRELFGEKFRPMTQMMNADAYNRHLAEVDVMVFNHRRPQGFGNMLISTYLGAKVYMRTHVSTWDYLVNGEGCKLFDVMELVSISFEEFLRLDQLDRQRNSSSVAHLFSRQWQKAMWRDLYVSE